MTNLKWMANGHCESARMGVVLAEHLFAFAEATEEAIRRHIGEDGEINTEMRAGTV